MVAFTGEWELTKNRKWEVKNIPTNIEIEKILKFWEAERERIAYEAFKGINYHYTPGTMSWPPVVKTEEPQPEYRGPVSEDFDFIRTRLEEIKKERQPKPEPEIFSIEPIITSGSVCRNCGYNYRVHNQECPACNDPPPKDTGDFYD